jgi:hypothetical protein
MLVGEWRHWRLAIWIACGALIAIGCGATAPSADSLEFEFDRAFGPNGSNVSEFAGAGPVAVDPSDERVYVLDYTEGALYKFDFDGSPVAFGGSNPNVSGNKLSGLSVSTGLYNRQLAVDSVTHVIYLLGDPVAGNATSLQAYQTDGDPSEFTAGPGAGTNKLGGFPGLRGVAVDSSGNIYLSGVNTAGETSSNVAVYKRSGAPLLEGAGGVISSPGNISVDNNGVLYVLGNQSELRRFTPSEYPVTAATTYTPAPETVDPRVVRSLAVDPLTNRLYALEVFSEGEDTVEQFAVFDEAGVREGTLGGPGQEGEVDRAYGIAVGSVELGGVQGPVARPFVTQNPTGGLAQAKIFQEKLCICAPSIEVTAADSVSSDSAVLRGKINPNNRDTKYWFEYGQDPCNVGSCTKVPLEGSSIGHGRKGVVVTQPISGLESATLYHYRVVGTNETNEINTSKGPDMMFMTQGSGRGVTLGDSRVWEMVSPAQKYGGALINSGEVLIQASASGEGLAYASLGPVVERPASNYLPDYATVLTKRGENGAWRSDDLTPIHQEAGRLTGTTPFKLFSPDLLRAALEPTDKTPLSPKASERTPYLWTDDSGSFGFTPFVSPDNVSPPGTKFGAVSEGVSNPVRLEGASPDLSHVVIRSQVVPLVEGAAPNGIYTWGDGSLELISKLPASEGGEAVIGMLGSGEGSVRHAVSEDGSRVFWTPSELYGPASISLPSLYLRDAIAGQSIRLDVAKPGVVSTGLARPAFNIASADGNVVFFTDSQQLTSDASPSGRDLYRCEIGIVEGGLGCAELTDISAPLAGSGESAEVLDQVSGASEDGTRLYFVARGVLDNTSNEKGEIAESGQPNLYYWGNGEGIRFIATLSDEDHLVWGNTSLNHPGTAERISAAASPDGRFFTFTSERSLTGYDNRNAGDETNTEVFVYDAEAEEDRLTCVSCNPSGAAAVGERLPHSVKVSLPDAQGIWADRWVAATLPEASTTELFGRSLYRPRSVLDNGRVFFNSVDPLVAADSNGNWDVYQYQPVGVGSCALDTDTAAVTRSGSGCVGLLSSGTANSDSGFLDASSSGDDVFFLTTGKLSVLDQDNEIDAYDARVNGIPAILNPAQECAGEACQPSVGPPNDPTPASEAFRGTETPVNCRKGQRKVQRNGKPVCVPKKKKHGKQQKKKRAGKSRRMVR